MSQPPRRRALLALAALGAVAVVGVRTARSSDHQDTPLVELNPQMDMTDVYAFPGSAPGRIALVLNSGSFLTPAQTPTAGFDPDLLYQFKVDNNGDNVEDRVIQVTFTGEGAQQQVRVRGPVAPPVTGAMMNTVAPVNATMTGATRQVLGAATGMQVFAGPRDDPFYIDLEQAFRILPDRRPVTGPLAQLPATPSASSFRPAGQAQNYVRGFNVLSIVIELPVSELTQGGTARLGLWGTISR